MGPEPDPGSATGAGGVSVVPANEVAWEDLRTVLGRRGPGSRCCCQRYKLRPGEWFDGLPEGETAARLREQTDCGHPDSERTSGLVAHVDGEPVGWCAVEPRPHYERLVRNRRVVWAGRQEDPTDTSVWAVTCVFARAGHRRQGVGRALVAAAVGFARDRGARALEGYPMSVTNVIDEELHVGTLSMFRDAGFTEVGRPTPRRVVVRLDL